MDSRTLRQLRRLLARRGRDHWSGSLTAAAAAEVTTLTSAGRVEKAGFFVNAFVYMQQSSPAQAEEVRVSASAPGSLTIPSPGLAHAWGNGQVYELHKRFSVEEYNDWIQYAILSAGSEAVTASVDNTSLVVIENAGKPGGLENEYAVPAGIRYISGIQAEDPNGTFNAWVPLDQVRVLPGSPRKLAFTPWAITALFSPGRRIRLLGQAVVSADDLQDSTEIRLDADFVLASAEYEMRKVMAASEGAMGQLSGALLRQLQFEVEAKRNSMVGEQSVLPGSLVIGP